ncbi:excinuclease ABC subunit UvrB [Candidatus Berkelbacteria bacterium]|nr:excinuclease ABC subunit UvrB [Candidatus Berkelbacteria bacterium]
MTSRATFRLKAPYQPAGDQPTAIAALVDSLQRGESDQILLGVTGSGKTFTIAQVIDTLNRPALVLAHNKTLAAQLTAEFRAFFPSAAVEYFVSYYDYYQPEAYLAGSDTYIEKEVEINDEIDRLRHAATAAVLARQDVIVVASVSAIYGLGSPDMYQGATLLLTVGQPYDRDTLIAALVDIYYARGQSFERGSFVVTGSTIDIVPPSIEQIYRIRLRDDVIETIEVLDLITRNLLETVTTLTLFPAKHFVVSPEAMKRAMVSIEEELVERVTQLERMSKTIEADRLDRRTRHDLALMRELGYCNGIENYSRHLTGRAKGEAPSTLLEYFPDNALTIIDESHVTIPQIAGMYEGDRSRKQALIDYGFRLPSALDNRPLTFAEFIDRTPQRVYVSATPGSYERTQSTTVSEQIIRPTGLVDPALEIKPVTGQVADAISEITDTVRNGTRVLVTTLTKKMAEDLAEHLKKEGVKATYLHSSVDTIERIRILEKLRLGTVDVLVGVNLLREGLDLPEVALVLILDADKEGFLRSETSLIQTIGRAARNVLGRVVLYADTVTGSMTRAIQETDRRRLKQVAYNQAHGITPETIQKTIATILPEEETQPAQDLLEPINPGDLPKMIGEKERQMKQLAHDLRFEEAALIRDEVIGLRKLNHTLMRK